MLPWFHINFQHFVLTAMAHGTGSTEQWQVSLLAHIAGTASFIFFCRCSLIFHVRHSWLHHKEQDQTWPSPTKLVSSHSCPKNRNSSMSQSNLKATHQLHHLTLAILPVFRKCLSKLGFHNSVSERAAGSERLQVCLTLQLITFQYPSECSKKTGQSENGAGTVDFSCTCLKVNVMPWKQNNGGMVVLTCTAYLQ